MNRTRYPTPALGLAAALAAVAAVAQVAPEGDANRGRLLYENHCTSCHTSRAHVRDNRKANSPAEIRGWVRRWQQVQGLDWDARDVRDVTTWLYLRYYDPQRPPASRDAPGGGSPA